MLTDKRTPLPASLDQAADALRARVGGAAPEVALVLGSGLGGLADELEGARFVPYTDVPGFPASTVEGHRGRLAFGQLAGRSVVAMQGRVHLYEGYTAADVVFPVRVMLALGARALIVTNAAGGIAPSFRPGDLMLITDHLNLTGTSPLLGAHDPALGPRFPDMSRAYDPELREGARRVAEDAGLQLREGVYAGLLGPSYETPAEVRMLERLGADAVGMSTVLEVVAAVHMGARVLGVSCISNAAAGLSDGPLHHDEVQAAANLAKEELTALVTGVVERIA
jgi:purine-nucleoside phosphorylase